MPGLFGDPYTRHIHLAGIRLWQAEFPNGVAGSRVKWQFLLAEAERLGKGYNAVRMDLDRVR